MAVERWHRSKTACGRRPQQLGLNWIVFRAISRGALVERIHRAMGTTQGILINAGAYTHTSIALRDALLGVAIPFVELHLSNTHARDSFRHYSCLADRAVGVVSGFGALSYSLALQGLIHHLQQNG